MSTSPTLETVDRPEITLLLDRIDTWSVDDRDAPRLRQLLVLLLKLIDEVESKTTTICKLERMLFGPKSGARHREPDEHASSAAPNDESSHAPVAASVSEPSPSTEPRPAAPGTAVSARADSRAPLA